MNSPEADVVVIGSGFGGSISANRLSLAGLKVLVLERGPWRDLLPVRSMGIARRAPFPYGMKSVTHLLRNGSLPRTGPDVEQVRSIRGVLLSWTWRLRGFGCRRGQSRMVRHARGAAGSGLLEGAASGSEPFPSGEILPQDRGRYGRRPSLPRALASPLGMETAARPGGRQMSPRRRAAPRRDQASLLRKRGGAMTEGDGGIRRQICAFDGDGFLGSRGGAKASVDFIYLAPVLNNGATVRDMCEVTKHRCATATEARAKYTVHFFDHRARKTETVRTNRVILAAGTMNTVRLLFASSSESAGLSPMPSLGRTFGGNGDFIGAWFKNSAEPPLFKSAPVLGRFKVDGQDTPFMGMWALAGIRFDTAAVRREKETGQDGASHRNGSRQREGVGTFRKWTLARGLRSEPAASLRENSGRHPRTGSRERLEDLDDQENDYRSSMGWRVPRRGSRSWCRRS